MELKSSYLFNLDNIYNLEISGRGGQEKVAQSTRFPISPTAFVTDTLRT